MSKARKILDCPIEGCNRSFCKESALQNHIKRHNRLFKCDQCDKTFTEQAKVSRILIYFSAHFGCTIECFSFSFQGVGQFFRAKQIESLICTTIRSSSGSFSFRLFFSQGSDSVAVFEDIDKRFFATDREMNNLELSRDGFFNFDLWLKIFSYMKIL